METKIYAIKDYELKYAVQHPNEDFEKVLIMYQRDIPQLMLPSFPDLAPTVKEQAEALGAIVFDFALPQNWVDKMQRMVGKNPCGSVVWKYNKGSVFGAPLAITQEWQTILEVVAHQQENN